MRHEEEEEGGGEREGAGVSRDKHYHALRDVSVIFPGERAEFAASAILI